MAFPNRKIVKMSKRKYIDQFFNKGILQLGTYETFRKSSNTEIGDKDEGLVTLIGQTDGKTAWGRFQSSDNAYIFCTYLGIPEKELLDSFGYDDCFIVNDPQGFLSAISNSLGAISSSYGKCVYCEDRALLGEITPEHSFQDLNSLTVEMIGNARHFVKTCLLYTSPSPRD